jgi:Biotin-lipoyl like
MASSIGDPPLGGFSGVCGSETPGKAYVWSLRQLSSTGSDCSPVREVAVADNQEVHAGDLLVKLDDRDYRAALAKTAAAVAGQHATLANLDAAGRLQEGDDRAGPGRARRNRG